MTKIKEVWRTIPGFEGLYEASNKGRIRGLKRVVATIHRSTRAPMTRTIRARVFRNQLRSIGYYFVKLSNAKIKYLMYVHRLIALTFLGPDERSVNHKNGIKTDNRIENLEYLTHRENIIHYHSQIRKRKLPTGVYKHPRSNLYFALIRINGVLKNLGTNKTIDEASQAYQDAKSRL